MHRPPTDVDTVRHLGAVVDLAHLAQSARDRGAPFVASIYAAGEALATLAELVDAHGRSALAVEHLDRLAQSVLALSVVADALGPEQGARP